MKLWHLQLRDLQRLQYSLKLLYQFYITHNLKPVILNFFPDDSEIIDTYLFLTNRQVMIILWLFIPLLHVLFLFTL